jgi:hypothetical protein
VLRARERTVLLFAFGCEWVGVALRGSGVSGLCVCKKCCGALGGKVTTCLEIYEWDAGVTVVVVGKRETVLLGIHIG